MISKLIVNFVLHILIIASLVTGNKFFDIQDVEIDRLLKKLNKPALKSIQSPDGDIIDCVHMKNHPIYDHPLFKNYTIQRRPSPHPEGWKNEPSDEEKKSLVTQLWTINGKCPKNSIPIRRTKREDILRTKSIERYGRKDLNNIRQLNLTNSTNFKREYAEIKLQGMFHGAQGIINVWKPYIQIPQDFSLAQVWLIAGETTQMNTIEFGWQVYPIRNLDYHPSFFTYWTADGYQTGCYNLNCAGFVLLNPEFALGVPIHNVSIMNGIQFHIPTSVWKDPRTGNWWLKVNYDILVGYWPSRLFNHLQNGATHIEFGGEILDYNHDTQQQHTTTKMGSGNFAEGGYKKASYFKNLQIFDQHDSWQPIQGITPFTSNANCYNIIYGYDAAWGNYFFYGGPGKNPNCL